MSTLDRKRGCLIGLAVGDALGAAVEFMPPGSFVPVSGYRAGGPHGLAPGEWTEDTSLALALAESIARAGWSLDDQARRYVDWRDNGTYSVNGRCFDIGNATNAALHRFAKTGNARTAGGTAESSSGNGSIMRLAPVPIHFAELLGSDLRRLSRYASESSITTHASPMCVSACRYLATILAGLICGLDREIVLSPDWEPLRRLRALEPLHPEIEAIASGSYRGKRPPDIRGSGFVVRSLEAALWAFHDASNFEQAVLRAVNLGDDADTTGAVCGQLAGALWGESGIPPTWRAGLARKDKLERALTGLLQETT
ncbi:MAG: ADP-ribosylglycohydrolase family protein [Aureliella sp.]